MVFSVKIQHGEFLCHYLWALWRQSDPERSKYHHTKLAYTDTKMYHEFGKEKLKSFTAVTMVEQYLKSSWYCWKHVTFTSRKKSQVWDHHLEDPPCSSASTDGCFLIDKFAVYLLFSGHNHFPLDNMGFSICSWLLQYISNMWHTAEAWKQSPCSKNLTLTNSAPWGESTIQSLPFRFDREIFLHPGLRLQG